MSLSRTGKDRSEDWKDNIRKSKIGGKLSKETRKKISNSMKDKIGNWLGKKRGPWSDERKATARTNRLKRLEVL